MQVMLGNIKRNTSNSLEVHIMDGRNNIGLHKYDKQTGKHSFLEGEKGLLTDVEVHEVFEYTRPAVNNILSEERRRGSSSPRIITI